MRISSVMPILIVLAVLAIPAPASPQQAAAPTPEQSVMLVSVMEKDGNAYRGVARGTAFFVSADGLAVTNSHVVWQAAHNPDRFKTIAVVGKSLFGAQIVCASRLWYDPSRPPAGGVEPNKDLALIRLTPPPSDFGRWGVRAETGELIELARAHEGPVPSFAPLRGASRPSVGERVRVLGYGDISAVPRLSVGDGTVVEHRDGADRTPTFVVSFTTPAAPGHSGSPVLNARNEVVGVWTWGFANDPARGQAIGAEALDPPCN
jgi:hypothetical protein